MTSKKKNEITLLNILFFVLVIFIHVSSHPVTNLLQDSVFYYLVAIPWRLSAFVVQGFIFLSGMKLFLKKEEKIDYSKYYKSRFKAVVLPYLLWAVIYYIYFCEHQYYSFEFSHLLSETLRTTVSGHFYFVFAIVQFYALVPLWKWLFKKFNHKLLCIASAVIMIVALITMPMFFSETFIGKYFAQDKFFFSYLLYWVLGCLAGLHYENLVKTLKKRGFLICALFIVIMIAEAVFNIVLVLPGTYYYVFLEILHVVYCVCAIFVTYFLALRITEKWDISKLAAIKYIDGASYNIYLCHCLVIYDINDKMAQWGITKIDVQYLIRTVVTYVVSVGACTLYCYVKSKIKGKIKNKSKSK